MFFCFLQQKNKKMLFFKRENAKTQRKKTASLHLNIQKGHLSRDTPKIQMKKLCLTKI